MSTRTSDTLERNFSVYPDCLRCIAAAFVFVSFARQPGIADAILSGYVWLWFVGILVSIHLIGFHNLRGANWILRLERTVRWLASRSMSLYLFHAPLLLFFACLIVIAVTLACVNVLSRLTEARAPQWRRALQAIMTTAAARRNLAQARHG